MPLFLFLLAAAAGVMLPLQAVVNARLGRAIGGPLWAAALSSVVVATILASLALALGKPWPRLSQMTGLPWWAWIGGLCGAVVLSATTAVAPRIGAANMIALVMTGQVLAAMTLDRLGWFEMAIQPFSVQRMAAAVLLIAGAVLMSV
ncbi:DMT family transporter [Pseudomonas sp. dw_358]|uniref:DMT family transporter n=1 Tax=Pseudomonas sp. dw_358 TaxID=2720083 RepID=UPI001BD2770E|nr:DMT family transporter [Pseudomonas sp. dw_358]